MKILQTARLILRQLSIADAEFIFELVNEPSWLCFIGDKGVKTIQDARNYILQGPLASYELYGFGPYLTALKGSEIPIGLCGLTKKEALQDVDIGFAFLPRYWGQGYAVEAATAVMMLGNKAFGLKRIVAVTTSDNHSSMKVIEKLGLRFEQMIRLSEDGPELKLFAPEA